MKKCASCTKDLPDAALHCVFCGAKQPPAPAVQQGMAKTAFGYSANDVMEQARNPPQRPSMPQQQPAFNPPPAFPPQQQPVFNPPPAFPPQQRTAPAPQPPQFQAAPQRPAMPPAQPQYPMAPSAPPPGPGNYVPVSPAGAPTMFNPGQPAQPQVLQAPSYRPNPPPAALQPTLVPAPQPPQFQAPQVPAMPIPASKPPPYFASHNQMRASRPIEPWRDSLRLMMFVWGVALLVAFATPLRTTPDLLFNWKLILDGAGTARLPPLMLAAVGLLAVVVAGVPMPSPARGLIAAVLGLAGIAVPIALIGLPPWQMLAALIGTLVLVPALLIRSEYREGSMSRLFVTIGAVGILLPLLVPQGGAIPLVNVFKGVIELDGLAKVPPALVLGLVIVVVMSLLAWLPAPVTGGAKLWAWLLILWSLIVHVTQLLVGGNIGDAITASPSASLVPWIAGGATGLGAAYLVLVGYGLASVVGKQLE